MFIDRSHCFIPVLPLARFQGQEQASLHTAQARLVESTEINDLSAAANAERTKRAHRRAMSKVSNEKTGRLDEAVIGRVYK